LKKTKPRRVAHRVSPRKTPRQARSQETVDVILRATAHILVSEGYEGTSTNRVAEVAGVSVGSLYQYFPGKEALVAALVEKHQAEVFAALNPEPTLLTLPLEQVARELIEAMLRAHAVNPALHKVLLEVAPRLGKHPHQLRDQGLALVGALLELHKRDMRPMDKDIAAFIIVQAVEALCHEALLSRQDLLKNPKYVDEMTELLLRYVRR
jgi:AcrR family transcriptional regulator